MKNTDKTKILKKLKAVSFTLSQTNIEYIESKARAETRGNRSLWLDQRLSAMAAGIQGALDV